MDEFTANYDYKSDTLFVVKSKNKNDTRIPLVSRQYTLYKNSKDKIIGFGITNYIKDAKCDELPTFPEILKTNKFPDWNKSSFIHDLITCDDNREYDFS